MQDAVRRQKVPAGINCDSPQVPAKRGFVLEKGNARNNIYLSAALTLKTNQDFATFQGGGRLKKGGMAIQSVSRHWIDSDGTSTP